MATARDALSKALRGRKRPSKQAKLAKLMTPGFFFYSAPAAVARKSQPVRKWRLRSALRDRGGAAGVEAADQGSGHQ